MPKHINLDRRLTKSPKVEYSLTEIGETFVPVLKHIGNWGKTYLNLKVQNK